MSLPNRFISSAIRLPLIIAIATLVFTPSCGAQDAATGKDWQRLYESREFKNDDGALPYRLMSPKDWDASEKYPLVIFFHGAGERGNDNGSQLVHGAAEFARDDRRSEFPAFVVFPQCPKNKRWVESDWSLPSGKDAIDEQPTESMELALGLVDNLCENLPIDKSRVYVTGLSMGGQGAWFAASQKPRRFAALLQICGGSDPQWAKRFDGIPIWVFHGQADSVVPVSRAREMIAALALAGHQGELRYVEYPNVGHNSWTQTFQRHDVFEWLFSQRLPSEAK